MEGWVEVPSHGLTGGSAVWENKRLKGSWTATSSAWAQVRTFRLLHSGCDVDNV